MLIGIIVIFLLLSNWLLCSIFVFFPIDFFNYLGSFGWIFFSLVILFVLSWCLGEN
ncbi:hypothetical protein Sta7437_0557 [Stanieria cyanosphaera PCC 7437]|uniref:Uncharacterized protein n=1 Tax=Stanieria cyanosphaera (strain ATCC 29371 / PCC 7437) TaxID=111780 RepID=K9XNR1_STAC7|nr:hypothetical protein Sta7437_0557 [Stanieria cyanosphaera PCC 7437]